jgi:co-chaperonin GroES (HSP10)
MKKLQTKSYEPVADSIWVRCVIDKPDNIYLPGNAKLPPFVEAEVLAVGPKCAQVKKGDTVLLNSVTIMAVKFGGEDYTFTKEDRIVAVVRGPLADFTSL